jgi:hypothetical protein
MRNLRYMLLFAAILLTVVYSYAVTQSLSAIFINKPGLSDAQNVEGQPKVNVKQWLHDYQCTGQSTGEASGFPVAPSTRVEGIDAGDEIIYKGIFKPGDNNVKLAIYSDDGCDVTITNITDGSTPVKILPRYKVGQALPSDASFWPLSVEGSYIKDKMYLIEVKYSNTCYLGGTDIDGCTLIAYDGLGGVLPAPVIMTNPDRYNILKNSTDNILPVLSNDYHVENSLIFLDTNPSTKTAPTALHGTLSFIAGKLNYVPNNNYVGTDTFTYNVYDSAGNMATESVEITVCNAFPTYPNAENNLTMSLYKKSATEYSEYNPGVKAGNNAYIGLTFSIAPGYKFVNNQTLPDVTVTENDLGGKSINISISGDANSENPVIWQKKVGINWISCESPINNEFGNKYGFEDLYYRCMILWDTTYQPTGHNADHTITMENTNNNKIDLIKFLGSSWGQSLELAYPTSKSIVTANMVITNVSTTNGNLDFIMYDLIGEEILSNPKIKFKIVDDGDNTHKYGAVIKLWPTKHRTNTEEQSSNSSNTDNINIVSELILKKENLPCNTDITMSFDDVTEVSGCLERGLYTFDIYLYEYDSGGVGNYIDWTVFKGIEIRTTKLESVFDYMYILDKSTDIKQGHDVWVENTTDTNGLTTQKLKYYYELKHESFYLDFPLSCGGSPYQNDIDVNLFVVDGLLNSGIATKYSLENYPTNKNEINVMHDGTDHTGITARTIKSTDPQDEWRVVFTGTYDCGKYYRRDHQPARMLAVNQLYYDFSINTTVINIVLLTSNTVNDGDEDIQQELFNVDGTVNDEEVDKTITQYLINKSSKSLIKSIREVLGTGDIEVNIINNCPLRREQLQLRDDFSDLFITPPTVGLYSPQITFDNYRQNYQNVPPRFTEYHTITVCRYNTTLTTIQEPEFMGGTYSVTNRNPLIPNSPANRTGTFNSPDRIIMHYGNIYNHIRESNLDNKDVPQTAKLLTQCLFENTLIHEIGHTFGIGHHNQADDVMPNRVTGNEWRMCFNRYQGNNQTPWGNRNTRITRPRGTYYQNQADAQYHISGVE